MKIVMYIIFVAGLFMVFLLTPVYLIRYFKNKRNVN
jgi:hypothetical protein